MYNNLPQQTPAYYYMPQTYQRPAAQAPQVEQGVPSAPLYPQPLMQPNYIKGRPVVSIDEARASQIDLDGSLHVFPDLNNKKIYTKQINMDGTATFNIFELVPTPVASEVQTKAYVTRDELEQIIEELRASLTQPKAPKPSAASFNL